MRRAHLVVLVVASLAACSLIGAGTASASGTIVFDGSPATGAPPATLGPYSMTPFGADPQPVGGPVDGVTGPTGTVQFSPSLFHEQIGNGWATWSHGYPGDVYATFGPLSTTITLPPGTSAFYLYAEPDPFAVFDISAVAQDGTTSGPIAVDGFAGASYYGFYSTGDDALASVTVNSDIDFAIGEFGIGSSSTRTYVALGDSYSSGEGNPPFFAGTDGPTDYCHRSPKAYAEVLGGLIGSAPLFYACSGAVTTDLLTTSKDTEPSQILRPGVDPSADLLTMTIGGNDADFSATLKTCIEQKLKADAFNAAIGSVAVWLGLGHDSSCAHSDSFVSSVITHIDNVFLPVKTTEQQVLRTVDPVNTSVIVADYPLLFPASHDSQSCLGLSIVLTNDDQDFMNAAGNHLDSVLQEAAAEAGVNFVDVRSAFAGHEVCGPDGAYLNGLSTASGSGGSCTWSVLGHCIIPGIPIIGSFHPNASGHADGYAASISTYMASALNRTPAGFPANPPPTPDPPATNVIPAVGTGELAAQPISSGSDDCSGTFQAGQQVGVSGSGFVPGTAVHVYVTSPGLGSTGEAKVADLTADASGAVAATVRVPLAATGFTQPGAAAGTVFIDAIGLGSASSHQDDVAMVGLAPRSSDCGTVETLPFSGFTPPVANPPKVNSANPGRAIPVTFSIAGSNATLNDVLAAGYPQSAPVSCAAPEAVTSGDPTVSVGGGSTVAGDQYNYVWKTDASWHGCRALIVKLVDGTFHRAVFNFGT
jgi:hypothetical protein